MMLLLYYIHAEVGVTTSTALLALDFRVSATSATELALVLGPDALCGERPSSGTRGGVGAAEVSIGGGSGEDRELLVRTAGAKGMLL